MFGLLVEEKGLHICADCLTAYEHISAQKEAALKDMKNYDDLIAAPCTEAQKRFLENERDSFLYFLETGYGILILRRLLEMLDASEQACVDFTSPYNEEKALFNGQIQLTNVSVSAMCGVINMLAANGRIVLNDKPIIPLSEDGYDFLGDGFDYVINTETSEMLAEFEKTAKESIKDTISSIKSLFDDEQPTPIQKLYIDFELKCLLIFLKEHFRGIAYQALLTSEIPTLLMDADKILINNSLDRLPIVLSIIDKLEAHGIIAFENEKPKN